MLAPFDATAVDALQEHYQCFFLFQNLALIQHTQHNTVKPGKTMKFGARQIALALQEALSSYVHLIHVSIKKTLLKPSRTTAIAKPNFYYLFIIVC